jgi:glutathione synthase/RimK-type ligase-like ATP-grasp enzyme
VKVAFATTTDDILNGEDADRPFHDEAFARAGATVDHCVWWDPGVPWGDYDLVVIRSPWDYVERLSEFRHWLQALDSLGTLRNPAPVVEWNLDKTYLLDLAARGIPITPTEVVSTAVDVKRALGSIDGEVVVKPAISAGSRQTGRFDHDDPQASSLAEQILARGTPVMIQPCISSVTTSGETGAIVFNGSISHAVRKGPILAPGGGFLGGAYAENITPTSLSVEQQVVVADTVAAVNDLSAERFGSKAPLLYARVDLVTLDDGSEAVLEVELAEPTLFLSTDPESAGRFLVAVEKHIRPAQER